MEIFSNELSLPFHVGVHSGNHIYCFNTTTFGSNLSRKRMTLLVTVKSHQKAFEPVALTV